MRISTCKDSNQIGALRAQACLVFLLTSGRSISGLVAEYIVAIDVTQPQPARPVAEAVGDLFEHRLRARAGGPGLPGGRAPAGGRRGL